jgi:hypothetical protein
VNFIASFLEGQDELLVALGDVPATVNDDESGLGAGHGSWRFFFFFCVRDAHARNLRILKRLDADGPLAWRIHRRFTNGGRRGRKMREEGLKKTVKRGRHYSAVKKCDICARRCITNFCTVLHPPPQTVRVFFHAATVVEFQLPPI